MLEARSARRKPEVSAARRGTWRARGWFVRDVAMPEKMASPTAAPSWSEGRELERWIDSLQSEIPAAGKLKSS
jgi:hypothetical protein